MNRSRIIRLLCLLAVALLVICSCDVNPNAGTESETPSASIEESSESKTESSEESSETETTAAKPSKVTYTVTVVDEDGNPLSGATVQLCVGDLCKLPTPTDSEGVATFTFDEAEYTVKVTLSGYTGETSYTFPEGSSELTVVLTAN